ncbi:ABC transporter permease [Aminipila sp.]|uniref:ABC transporter permease n=1 Tax=Aminipila sp. TaxID=2060095 RepID=UPI0028A144FB|nr:ABC transporter permease [Aminipila sp.]
MIGFEIKKVFSKPINKAALLFLIVTLIIVSILTINNVRYVDENGDATTGITAAKHLRELKNQWAGYVKDDVLSKVIEENTAINNSKEALSDIVQEKDKAYAKKQGFSDIVDMISNAFVGFGEYDYYRADRVTTEEVGMVYENRISNLKEWLDSGKEHFSDAEKDFLIGQYQALKTPFYYEYTDGWQALLQNISTVILILALIIGFFVAGVFSDEFQLKADSIFFSTKLGRNKAVRSKIGAGFLITTLTYIIFVFLYSMIVLLLLGTDGAGCPIQWSMWKSFYNVTYFQAYLLIVFGGYIGTLFAMTVSMLVSAKTHSTVVAIMIPFILLCVFPFLSRIITLPQICSLFPDQLLEVFVILKDSGLYEIGGKVMGTIAVIIPAYLVPCIVLQPILYGVYKRAEIR